MPLPLAQQHNNQDNTTTWTTMRLLGGEDDNGVSGHEPPCFEDYDSTGGSCGLAWRCLGVHLDDDGCYSRKVLWASVSLILAWACLVWRLSQT